MRVFPDASHDAIASDESTEMTVDSSKHAKLYMMMSSSLYTDKHMSILRELCSNAHDSHLEAGVLDIPFAITAPTVEYPFLTISDAGVGLTYETAKKTILMFLGSTKDGGKEGQDDKADEFVGGWGIGAKSPRSYTPNYQLILRKDGIESHVQVFDQQGKAHSMEMLSKTTSQRNGLEFIVPVQQIDLALWRKKIQSYMENTNYNVVAYMGMGEVLHPTKPEASIDYGDFVADIYGQATRGSSAPKPVTVVYGGMRYDIPAVFEQSTNISKIQKALAPGIEMRIRVNKANRLSFGLSRESLEVTDANMTFMSNALNLVAGELEGSISVKQQTLFENEKVVATYAQVIAANTAVKLLIEGEEASKFAAYTRKMARSISWSTVGMRTKEHSADTVLSTQSKIYYSLPFAEKPVKVKVLWSKKQPMQRDWAAAVSVKELAYICWNSRTEEEARAEIQATSNSFPGCEVEFCEVISTRGKRVGTGHSANTGAIFATCDHRKTRTKIKPGVSYVLVDSPDQFWIGKEIPDVHPFVATKSFMKREDLPDNVMSYEDLLSDPETKEFLETQLKGWDLSEEECQILLRSYEKLAERSLISAYPRLAAELLEAKVAVKRLVEQEVENSKRLRLKSYREFLPEYPDCREKFLKALKAANDVIVSFNKCEDLLKVIHFGKIKQELDEGNPEAKRLVCAMGLEQYYE